MKPTKLILLLFIFAGNLACVEEINVIEEVAVSFESALVIEATITNEFKTQEVKLSRAYQLNAEGPLNESNANVKVIDNNSNEYSFQEVEPGVYKSINEFAAQQDVDYELVINTQDGSTYGSSTMKFVQHTVIDDLYAERSFDGYGLEGVSIYLNSYDATGKSKYYRHEYEETYRIEAPLYSPKEMISNEVEFPIPVAEQPQFETYQEYVDFVVTTQFRPEQERVCYKTVSSKEILITSTSNQVEDRLDHYKIRFIGRENPEIMHRYSILVRQYVQSYEANSFYEALKSQSLSESILTETQPGFLEGNVFSKNDSNEMVIGFFEVVSVDEKRAFFSYDNLFPGEEKPDYYISCDDFLMPDVIRADPLTGDWLSSPLADLVKYSGYQYFDDNGGGIPPYRMVHPECGDCTYLGDNTEPEWWID